MEQDHRDPVWKAIPQAAPGGVGLTSHTVSFGLPRGRFAKGLVSLRYLQILQQVTKREGVSWWVVLLPSFLNGHI